MQQEMNANQSSPNHQTSTPIKNAKERGDEKVKNDSKSSAMRHNVIIKNFHDSAVVPLLIKRASDLVENRHSEIVEEVMSAHEELGPGVVCVMYNGFESLKSDEKSYSHIAYVPREKFLEKCAGLVATTDSPNEIESAGREINRVIDDHDGSIGQYALIVIFYDERFNLASHHWYVPQFAEGTCDLVVSKRDKKEEVREMIKMTKKLQMEHFDRLFGSEGYDHSRALKLFKSDACANCKKIAHTNRRCKGCYEVYYCSVDCQRQDWKVGGHRERCRAALNKEKPPKTQHQDQEQEHHQEQEEVKCCKAEETEQNATAKREIVVLTKGEEVEEGVEKKEQEEKVEEGNQPTITNNNNIINPITEE